VAVFVLLVGVAQETQQIYRWSAVEVHVDVEQ
jgi:hypothetical protein